MIGRIESTLPNTQGDIDLAQGDATRAKAKKARPEERPEGPEAFVEPEENTPAPPVHIRHLGKNLDLIA